MATPHTNPQHRHDAGGIGGEYVTRLLDSAAILRGYPSAVRTDNGPDFTSRTCPAEGDRSNF